MRTEKQLQNYIKKQALKRGILFYKLECVGQRGFPDVMLAKNGRFALIELKSPSGKGVLSHYQKKIIAELRAQSIPCLVVFKQSQADDILRFLEHGDEGLKNDGNVRL